jgi:hypothetical protein
MLERYECLPGGKRCVGCDEQPSLTPSGWGGCQDFGNHTQPPSANVVRAW